MVTTVYALRVFMADNGSADLLLFTDRESAEHYGETIQGLLGIDRTEIVERRLLGLLALPDLHFHRRMWDAHITKLAERPPKKARKARARRYPHAVSA